MVVGDDTHLSAGYYCTLSAHNSTNLTAFGPQVEVFTGTLVRNLLHSAFNANLFEQKTFKSFFLAI